MKKRMTERGENVRVEQQPQTSSMSFGVDKNKFKSAFDKMREEKERKQGTMRTGYRRPPAGTYTSLHANKYGQPGGQPLEQYEGEEEEEEEEVSGYPYHMEEQKA